MSFSTKINIDNLDKRFQVTFLKKYQDNKSLYSESLKNKKTAISSSTANFIYLTKVIAKDLIVFPFIISFATALAKIFIGKYSVVLYRHGFVMGTHLKRIISNSYQLYFPTFAKSTVWLSVYSKVFCLLKWYADIYIKKKIRCKNYIQVLIYINTYYFITKLYKCYCFTPLKQQIQQNFSKKSKINNMKDDWKKQVSHLFLNIHKSLSSFPYPFKQMILIDPWQTQ